MVIKPSFVFLVLVLFSCFTGLLGQDYYPVRGTVFIRDGKASQVNLVINTKSEHSKIPVDLNGNFITQLKWGKNYRFCFSKKGYVSKSIDFSTKIPDQIDKEGIYPYEILVELFPMYPGVDTVFFKNPVAKIHFNQAYNDFDYDTDYQLAIKYKLEKAKSDFNKWSVQKRTNPKPKKDEITKDQNISAIRYKESVEIVKKKVIPKPKSRPIIQPKKENTKNPFNLPPLKKVYPEGKSVEIYTLKGKQITRVIIKKGEFQKVFYQVKHDWGGLFYFVQESPSYYRSISKYNFNKATNI